MIQDSTQTTGESLLNDSMWMSLCLDFSDSQSKQKENFMNELKQTRALKCICCSLFVVHYTITDELVTCVCLRSQSAWIALATSLTILVLSVDISVAFFFLALSLDE